MNKDGQKSFLSVIIPFYNEERNLEQGMLDEVHQYLEKQDYTWEVILVDDQSTDQSRRLAEDYIGDKDHYTLVAVPHGGKPRAIWAGVRLSRGEILLL